MSWDLIAISPHLDDAAFSCGATLAAATRQGKRVLIATCCTADAEKAALSPLAEDLHARWALGPRPYVARRAEDQAATAILGADFCHLGLLDALYRRDPRGACFYPHRRALFGPPAAADPAAQALAEALRPLAAAAPCATVLVPLAIGGHVDHRLARQVATSVFGDSCEYYEDLPYARSWRQRLKAQLWPWSWTCQTSPLQEEDWQRKLSAMAAFASQWPMVWPNVAQMAAEIRDFGRRRGGERLWQRD